MAALVFILLIVVVTLLTKRSFTSFIYVVVIIDIFFRILTFIKLNLLGGALYNVIDQYIPDSLNSLVSAYTSGLIETILIWSILVIYAIFEFYVIRTFLRKK